MIDLLLFGGVHLTECARLAIDHEHRIITEALAATRRPDQCAGYRAFEQLIMPVGPRERQRAEKARGSVDVRALFGQFSLNLAHRHVPVPARATFEGGFFCPVGGIDAGRTAQGCGAHAAIVCQGDLPGGLHRRARLD